MAKTVRYVLHRPTFRSEAMPNQDNTLHTLTGTKKWQARAKLISPRWVVQVEC